MRFMIVVKATKESEAGVMPHEQMLTDMAKYHEELQKAGVLLDASGLQASAKGWRIKYSGQKRTLVDGPFAEAKELIAGYTMIQVKSKDEAMEWPGASPIRRWTARKARSRSASCSSWTISGPAKRWSASAKWTSREPGTLARRHDDRLRSSGPSG